MFYRRFNFIKTCHLFLIIVIFLHYCVNAMRISEYLKRNKIRKIRINRSMLDDFLLKDEDKKRPQSFFGLNEYYKDTKVIGPRYFCRDKDDEGQYEHAADCHKYWHCLYVGTIFEIALERKCPIGTMFHPLDRACEISTMIKCSSWRRSIYGDSYVEPATDNLTDEYLSNYYLQEFQKNMLAKTDSFTSIKTNDYKLQKAAAYLPLISEKNPFKNSKNTTTTTTKTTVTTTTPNVFVNNLTMATKAVVSTANISTARLLTGETSLERKSVGINFSPLDELLIEKISYIKANRLNKTQMSNHLNLIKHIFEFKNNAQAEVSYLEPNNTQLQMYINNKTQQLIRSTNNTQTNRTENKPNETTKVWRAENVDGKKFLVNELDEHEWDLLPDYKRLNSLKKSGVFQSHQKVIEQLGFATKTSDSVSLDELMAEQMRFAEQRSTNGAHCIENKFQVLFFNYHFIVFVCVFTLLFVF